MSGFLRNQCPLSAGLHINTYYPCATCTSSTVSGLANGATYVFGVWAQNAAGTSGGVTSNAVVAGAPAEPRSPAAHVRNQGALVAWTAPISTGASVIDAYGIFAYKYPSLEYVSYTQACGTCTSVKVSGLSNGQQYILGVYAHNSVNWGPGVPTNVVVPAPTVPDAPPSVFAAPVANGTVDVAWSVPPDSGGSAIDSYWVGVYKTTPSLTYVRSELACSTCTSRNMGGLTAGQPYQFYVAAHNAYGYGGLTGSNVVTAGSSPDLLKPTSVQVTRGDRQATVSWVRPIIRLEGLTSYVVKAFPESNPTQVAATATVSDPVTTAALTGLTNGQRYFATVTASTLLVINAQSAPSTVFVPAGAPFAPTGVTATRADEMATISWLTPLDNGAAINGFEIAPVNTETGAEVGVMAAAQSPADVRGLVNGTPYAFKVRAVNTVGPGPYSSLSNTVTPAGVPFAPPNVQGTAGDRSATISWGTANGNGAEVWGYVVGVSGVGSYHLDGDARMATIFGLTNDTPYTFSVRARNVVGDGAAASVSLAPTAPPPPPTGAPNPPTALLATASGSGQTNLSWAPPTELNGSTLR